MPDHVVLLTIPGLRADDLASMPNLRAKLADGDRAALAPTFPCLAGPVRANMATGVTCGQHGVVADCLYDAEPSEVVARPPLREMLMAPALWQVLSEHRPDVKSTICFESDGCDFELAAKQCPDFLWCELSHIAASAERAGPDSEEVQRAQDEVVAALGRLFSVVEHDFDSPPLWIVVSPYTISSVSHVLFPNRMLRESGLLSVHFDSEGEHVELQKSRAWAMTDRQITHVYVAEHDPATVAQVVRLFNGCQGVAEVLAGDERGRYDLVHERAGDVIVVSTRQSWQSYAWWLSDDRAPPYVRTIGDHRKLGVDPLEQFVDAETGAVPLSADRIRGSHGAPAIEELQRGVIFTSERGVLAGRLLLDTDICDLVLRQFGV